MFRPLPIDLETTGLDLRSHVILEFGLTLVTNDLKHVEHFGSRVVHATEAQLAGMNSYVREMHTGTGLLDEVRASTLSIADVDQEVSAWLRDRDFSPAASGIILGSNCRLDLNFIERDMPLLTELMTYRMIDISGIREAMTLWAPEALPSHPFQLAMSSEFVPHRVMSDIAWTLAEARDLQEVFGPLRPPAPAHTELIDLGLPTRPPREVLSAAQIDFSAWYDAFDAPGEENTRSHQFVREHGHDLIATLDKTLSDLDRLTGVTDKE